MHILSTFSLAWSTSQGRSRMIPNEEKPEVSSARSHPQDAPRLRSFPCCEGTSLG